jgi:putative nucleotidyltransferase with HDIG domain
MQSFLKIFIPSAATVVYLLLFIVAAFSKPHNTVKRRFMLYLVCMLLWSLSALIVLLDMGNFIFWFRGMTTFATASMIAFLYFTQSIINKKVRYTRFVYLYGLAAMLVCQFTNLVIPYADIQNGNLVFNLTPWIYVVAGPSYIVMLVCLILLMQSARQTKDENQVTRFNLFVIAVLFILIGGSLNFTDLGQYPVDIAANVIAALILAYAILRLQLLDIKVMVRKSVSYFIPTVIIGAAYFLIISISLEVFHATTKAELISTSLIVSIITALVLQPFKDALQNWIDRYFFRERFNAVKMIQRVSEVASSVIDLNQLSQMIIDEIIQTYHIQRAALFLRQNKHKNYMITYQTGMKLSPRISLNSDHPLITWLATHDCVFNQQDLDTNTRFRSVWGREKEVMDSIDAYVYVPLNAKGELLGFMALGQKLSEQIYTSEDKQILLTLSHQIAIAVQNAQLYTTAKQELVQRRETEQRLQLQLKRLSALQNINIAITTNIDLQIPLYLLLEQVTDQLGVDAADVLLMDEETQQLFFVAGRGFQTDALKYTKLNIGEGLAGHAAEIMDVVYINNLGDEETSLRQSPLLDGEEFVAYYGAPLISKGKVQGVLELFHRSPMNPDEEWEGFLSTLTSETAIAVDNALMFRDLEKSNLDLAVAYETTLEGWARTLEMRDRETQGHSQRVLDLTLRLARKLGFTDEELVHVQRGALLHDIGKMGVPDNILLKEGPLTDEEWEIMHKHPVYAYDMLSTIPFLRKAIDIPYSHHEKWDGSGYPRGLKREEIPLAARIFAVVDVWDALRSDRPYRPAWSDEKALSYIKEESGKHFDPIVVDAFMEIQKLEQRKTRKK